MFESLSLYNIWKIVLRMMQYLYPPAGWRRMQAVPMVKNQMRLDKTCCTKFNEKTLCTYHMSWNKMIGLYTTDFFDNVRLSTSDQALLMQRTFCTI